MFGLSPIRKNEVQRNNSLWNFDSMFDNFFEDSFFPSFGTAYTGLNVDIKEEENEFQIIAEVPGLKKEEIKVNIENDLLTIAVEKREESNHEKDNYIRKERKAINMQRSFRLENVKSEEIAAKLEDGILTLTLPKQEPVKPKAKEIEIE